MSPVSDLNLSKLVNELLDAGVTQVAIAERLRVRQATVSRYRSGEIETCAYSIGKSLVELHERHVRRRRRSDARA